MFSRIKTKGLFTLNSGVKSGYDYDYSLLSDSMNRAFCRQLSYKLKSWQLVHGKFNTIAGIETEGIRIGFELAELLKIPFIIIPHEQSNFRQLEMPNFSPDTHWLIVDDIVTTGKSFLRAVNFLDVEEKQESFTFAAMIRRNPANLDYSEAHGDRSREEKHVVERRFDFIDKRLITLYQEPE